MNFSFVLPSRGRKEDVVKMLDSFERTTKYKKDIEFFIAVDPDKSGIRKVVEKQYYSFDVRILTREKTKDFTNDYYNWLANKTGGKNVVAFNDDAWMRTNHWDVKILRTISEYGWTIYMLDVPDTARIDKKHWFPCFPMVSRRALSTLGFLLCPEVRMYPADKVTYEIYYMAQRIIPIRNVMIEHEHVAETDESKKGMMEIFAEDKELIKSLDISQYVYKMLKVAANENNKRASKIRRIINILKEE